MKTVDLLGERCPDLQLMIRKEVRKLANPGDQVEILSDDPTLEGKLNQYGQNCGILKPTEDGSFFTSGSDNSYVLTLQEDSWK